VWTEHIEARAVMNKEGGDQLQQVGNEGAEKKNSRCNPGILSDISESLGS